MEPFHGEGFTLLQHRRHGPQKLFIWLRFVGGIGIFAASTGTTGLVVPRRATVLFLGNVIIIVVEPGIGTGGW